MTRLVKIPKLKVIADIKENRKHLVTLAPNAKSRVASVINEHIVTNESILKQYSIVLLFEDVLAWPDDYENLSSKEQNVLKSEVVDIVLSLTRFSQFGFIDCYTNSNMFVASLHVYDSWLTKVKINGLKKTDSFLNHSKTQDFLFAATGVGLLAALTLALFNVALIIAFLMMGETVAWFNWVGLATTAGIIFYEWLTND